MARQFAQLQLRIWVDEDWTDLSIEAQHLYSQLLSQEELGESGLIPLRPRRWAKLSRNGSVEKVNAALAELDAASFLVVDTETAEVLVRTLIRNGGIYKHVRMLKAALNQAERAESPRVRSAMGQELAKLPPVAVPEPNSRNAQAIEEAKAEQEHLDDVISMLNDAPPDPSHGMAPWDEAMGWGHPTVTVTVPVSVLGSCTSKDHLSLEVDAGARRHLDIVRGELA